MKITQVVPIVNSKKAESKDDGDEYDRYICFLYDENYSLANTFDTHKQQLVDGQDFLYYNKSPCTDIRLSISYDYSKLMVYRSVIHQ